jgi:hypothetical protein
MDAGTEAHLTPSLLRCEALTTVDLSLSTQLETVGANAFHQ